MMYTIQWAGHCTSESHTVGQEGNGWRKEGGEGRRGEEEREIERGERVRRRGVKGVDREGGE